MHRQFGDMERSMPTTTTLPPSAGEQARALWLSTIAFTVCFAAWTIFSILGVQIKQDLGLNQANRLNVMRSL